MITCGIDIGARTVDAAVMESGEILAALVRDSGPSPRETAARVFDEILRRAGVSEDGVGRIVATGYGRNHFSKAHETVSEITCHARGVLRYFPHARLIIDIGGQDSKVIELDPDGRVVNFAMNDRCAAGTGRFIEMAARILDLSIDEAGKLGAESGESREISSMCAVFAESEIVGLTHDGAPPGAILKGVFHSVAKRTLALASRFNFSGDIAFTGGVAKNPGVVRALEELSGARVRVPDEPQMTGAIGAAILAASQDR